MNYGGIDDTKSIYSWTKWRKEFLWWPKSIEGKRYWLRTVHVRYYMADWDPRIIKQEQYAVDVFDLMQKDSK